MKKNLSTAITLLLIVSGTQVFSQKLTTEEVKQKLSRSWTATEVGNPGETLFPKENKEIMDFNSDGILHIVQESKMMGTMNIDARWEFDEAKQKLLLMLTMGDRTETQELEIIELTNNRLELVSSIKQSVYVPSEMIGQQQTDETPAVTATETVTNEGLNPEAWTGSLSYNLMLKMGNDDKEIKESVPGVITLEMDGDQRIIKKVELGTTVIWKITGESIIANITRYSAVSSALELNGEITFQNGFMMLEVYAPEYMSYYYVKE